MVSQAGPTGHLEGSEYLGRRGSEESPRPFAGRSRRVFVLETNVVSVLVRQRPNAGVLCWIGAHPTFALSAVAVEELVSGIARAKAEQRTRLAEWFEELSGLATVIVPVHAAVARLSGRLRASRERASHPVAQADVPSAASTVIAGGVRVTRNTKDFEGLGATLLNPFS